MRYYLSFLIISWFGISSVSSQLYLTPQFASVDIIPNIEYGEAMTYEGVDQTLLLDLYMPSTGDFVPRPLVVYAHGGGFIDQSQSKNLPHIQNYCDSLARRGYAVASINYRLDSTICNRAVVNAMHDMKAAIRFLKTESIFYGIDTSLVFVMGESAGAITALNSGYIDQPSELPGPTMSPFADDLSVEGNSGSPAASSDVKAVFSLCGGTLVTGSGIIFDTLAIDAPDDPPLVIVHGTDDALVPISGALDLALRAEHIGLPSLFYVLEGATHCPWFTGQPDAMAYLDTLIDSTVPFMYSCIGSVIDDVSENGSLIEWTVGPNPTKGKVYISWNALSKPLEIEILDLYGRSVIKEQVETGNTSMSLDLEDLSLGVHLLHMTTGSRSRIEKILKVD